MKFLWIIAVLVIAPFAVAGIMLLAWIGMYYCYLVAKIASYIVSLVTGDKTIRVNSYADWIKE